MSPPAEQVDRAQRREEAREHFSRSHALDLFENAMKEVLSGQAPVAGGAAPAATPTADLVEGLEGVRERLLGALGAVELLLQRIRGGS